MIQNRNAFHCIWILICLMLLLSCTTSSNEIPNENSQISNETGYLLYVENDEISLMESSGRKIEVIAPQIQSAYEFGTPRWSPTGEQIAFIKKNEYTSPAELVILDFSISDSYYYNPINSEENSSFLSNYELQNRKFTHTLLIGEMLSEELFCDPTNVMFDWKTVSDIGVICQSGTKVNDGDGAVIHLCVFSLPEVNALTSTELSCKEFDNPSEEYGIGYFDISPGNANEFLISFDSQESFLFNKDGEIIFSLNGIYPTWSSDGQKIAYVNTSGSLNIYDIESGEDVVIYDPEKLDKSPLDLTTEEMTYEWYKNVYPWWGQGITWGNNDNNLYFSASRFIGTRPHIFKIDIQSKNIEQLTVDDSVFPHYFPLD